MSTSSASLALVADIGATHARFASVTPPGQVTAVHALGIRQT